MVDNRIESGRVQDFRVDRVLRHESTLQLQFTASRFALMILFHVSSRTGGAGAAAPRMGNAKLFNETRSSVIMSVITSRSSIYSPRKRVGFRHYQKDAVERC